MHGKTIQACDPLTCLNSCYHPIPKYFIEPDGLKIPPSEIVYCLCFVCRLWPSLIPVSISISLKSIKEE